MNVGRRLKRCRFDVDSISFRRRSMNHFSLGSINVNKMIQILLDKLARSLIRRSLVR